MTSRLRARYPLVLGVLLMGTTLAAPAMAQDDASRSAARRMATTGVEAYQRDDYATAVDKLERAYQVLRVPSIGLWLARALAKQGRLVAASERYLEVGRLSVAQGDAQVQENAKKEAATEVEALLPKIPSVVVTLQGATASEVALTLDGAPLATALLGEPRPVDPGKHRIEARRGHEVVVADVTVAISENKAVTVRFEGSGVGAAPGGTPASPSETAPGPVTGAAPAATSDSAPSSSSTKKTLGWVALGVGAAGIAVGGITGGLALGKKGDFEDSPECEGTVCRRSTMQDELDSYSTLRTVSSVGFIAGGVLAVTGVVLLVTGGSSEAKTSAYSGAELRLRLGASTLWAEGSF
jgi:hypothetical protein